MMLQNYFVSIVFYNTQKPLRFIITPMKQSRAPVVNTGALFVYT